MGFSPHLCERYFWMLWLRNNLQDYGRDAPYPHINIVSLLSCRLLTVIYERCSRWVSNGLLWHGLLCRWYWYDPLLYRIVLICFDESNLRQICFALDKGFHARELHVLSRHRPRWALVAVSSSRCTPPSSRRVSTMEPPCTAASRHRDEVTVKSMALLLVERNPAVLPNVL